MIVLRTSRLALREITHDDHPFLAAMMADREVMRHFPKTNTPDEVRAWIERQRVRYADEGHGVWLVEDRQRGRPLGRAGLAWQQVLGVAEPEIGYMLHRPFWRLGYANEAAAAIRDYAFETLAYDHVISLVRPENVASQGVARSIGMRPRTVACLHAELRHMIFELRREA